MNTNKTDTNKTLKARALLRDDIIPHHPFFKDASDAQKAAALADPLIFNVEHMVEVVLAIRGKYDFVDAEGYDFSDYSDSKTAILDKRGICDVGGVESKIGAIRLTVYLPQLDRLDYFFIPKQSLDRLKRACYGVNDHKQRLRLSYSMAHDHWNSYEPYRLFSSEALALAEDK